MASELDGAASGGIGLAFLLTEMRDLRKGLETRDTRISESLDGFRKDMTKLSSGLEKSQNHMVALEDNVSKMGTDVHALREDVDQIISERNIEKASWSGPKRVLITLGLIGAAIAGLLALGSFFGPAIGFIAVP